MILTSARTFIASTVLIAAGLTAASVWASPAGSADLARIDRDATLSPAAQTWSQSVCLGDLVEDSWLKSRCAVDRQTCCAWNLGGEREKTFTRQEITREVAKMDFGGIVVELKGADSVQVTQTHRELLPNELTEKIQKAATLKFGGPGGTVKIAALHDPEPIYVPLQDIETSWDVALPETLTSRLMIKVVSTVAQAESLGWVQADVKLTSEAYAAKKTIHLGDALRVEDFELRKVDVLQQQASGQIVLTDGHFPEAARARQSVLAGAPLTSNAVERIPSIRLGDTVTLVLRSDGLRISTKGVAQGTGAVGDMVSVQLSRYNRTFRGRVIEDRTVEVWL